jgi:L-alanine-DL-glutamate epimerase-like enolase superfamily enzyme
MFDQRVLPITEDTAIHFGGSPVGCMAAVHLISTLKDFIVMENHAVDIPWWGDLVTGPAKPIIQDGYIPVPDGLGVPQFDNYILDEFRTGGPYPHLDGDGKLVNTPQTA